MSRRPLKICAHHSQSMKVGRSEHSGAGGRARSRRQMKESNHRLEKVPLSLFPLLQGRLLEGHRWQGVQTALPKRKWVQNPAIARIQTTSGPCAKQSHENGHDQRRLISIRIVRKILRMTFIFACLKKRHTRRGPLTGWGVKRGSYAYNWLSYCPLLNFIFGIPSAMHIDTQLRCFANE